MADMIIIEWIVYMVSENEVIIGIIIEETEEY